MPRGYYTPFTQEEEQKIKDEFLLKPVKRLADELGVSGGRIMRFLKKNGLEIPKELANKRKKDSQKKKGDIPFNKGIKRTEYMSEHAIAKSENTQFKKGNKPHNTRYNGHERINKDGYIEVRVSENNYKLKHLYNWEQLHGKLPKGYCLKCIDGNKNNTNPDNWRLITRAENMLINSKHDYPEEIIPSMALRLQLNNKLKSLQDGEK